MSKNGRKAISFSEADHARIVKAAVARGYTVGAGAGSELGKFVVECVIGKTVDFSTYEIITENDLEDVTEYGSRPR